MPNPVQFNSIGHCVLRAVVLAVICSVSCRTVLAEQVAIIGTGNVGSTLGIEFAEQGHEIIYGARNPDREDVIELVRKTGERASANTPRQAVIGADIVVLAVPGLMVGEITQSLGDLDAKIIIDPTNPLIGWDEKNLRLREGESNAEIIQRLAPNSSVVKAFSTLNVSQMENPENSPGPISILLAGNDQAAKSVVAGLAQKMGLSPIDLGSIAAASYIEGMSVLLLNNRIQGRARFDFYLMED